MIGRALGEYRAAHTDVLKSPRKSKSTG